MNIDNTFFLVTKYLMSTVYRLSLLLFQLPTTSDGIEDRKTDNIAKEEVGKLTLNKHVDLCDS